MRTVEPATREPGLALATRDKWQDQDLITLLQRRLHSLEELNRLAINHDAYIRKDGPIIGIEKVTVELIPPSFSRICYEVSNR